MAECEALIAKYEPTAEGKSAVRMYAVTPPLVALAWHGVIEASSCPHAVQKLLGIHGFSRLLQEEFSGAEMVHKQDWSLPLHNYFICASHNTYVSEM